MLSDAARESRKQSSARAPSFSGKDFPEPTNGATLEWDLRRALPVWELIALLSQTKS